MTTASSLFAPTESYPPDSVLVTDASGMVTTAPNPVQSVEYAYGTTSDVQGQIDGKQTIMSGNELSSIASVPLLGPGNISLDGVPFLCMVQDPHQVLSTNSSYVRPDGRWVTLKNSPQLKSWLGKPSRRPELSFVGRLPFRNPALPGPKFDRLTHDGTYFITWTADHQFFYSMSGDYWNAGLPPKWPANSNYICVHGATDTWLATFYAGVGNSGVKVSTNKGTTWTTFTHKYFTEDNFWSACAFADGCIVLADYNSPRIAYSTNMGSTWQYGENAVSGGPSYGGLNITVEGILRSMYAPISGPTIVGVETGSGLYPRPAPPTLNWGTNRRQSLYSGWVFNAGTSTSFTGRLSSHMAETTREYADTTGTLTLNPTTYAIQGTGAYSSLSGTRLPYSSYGRNTVDYRYPLSFANGRTDARYSPDDYPGYCNVIHPRIQFAFVEPNVGGYFANDGADWEFFDMPIGFSTSATYPAENRIINGDGSAVTVTNCLQLKGCVSPSGNTTIFINPDGEYVVFNTTLKNPTEARVPNIVDDVGSGGDFAPPDTCLKII